MAGETREKPADTGPWERPGRIAVTGASGNLGRKLIAHLADAAWCEAVVAIDLEAARPAFDAARIGKASFVAADLSDAGDPRWRQALHGVEAVVHFAAHNPYPDASWDDAALSLDMTLNVAQAALQAGARRLVFASSNHVMGRYKDPPLADGLSAGTLRVDRPAAPGTRYFNGERVIEDCAYAAAKLMGERVAASAARMSGGTMTSVSVRIGWVQPGANRPETINPTGVASADVAPGREDDRDLTWFRNMWLSNPDFLSLMESALTADPHGWPDPAIIVNGMSANAGMAWEIASGARLIGYRPRDNVWRALPGSAGVGAGPSP
jgi:nucleoside-diphosphate-sugar epimerase